MARYFLPALIFTVLAMSCGQPGPTPSPPSETPAGSSADDVSPPDAMRPVRWHKIPPFIDDGDRESLQQALDHSRRFLASRPPGQQFVFGPREVTAKELVRALDRLAQILAANPSPAQLGAEVAYLFEALESVGNLAGEVLVTGYYEPTIAANQQRTAEYQVPIYGPPPGLVKVALRDFDPRLERRELVGRVEGSRLVPVPTRQEIRHQGALRGNEIAWARDPVDLFFLEVQGSGTLRFPNGDERRIGYAGSNGRSYQSIGRLLADEGKIERDRVSMQSIRAYLAAHPEDRDRVLDYNAAAVFFRQLSGPPVGNLGFPVTAGRTIATDQRIFPPAALAFLVTEIPELGPDGRTRAAGPLARFVFNQDTGGAIRGPGRVDYFWGRGPAASERAGAMKQPGRLLFLVPRAEGIAPLRR